MKNTKVHFKMYKAGKKWLFAGIATSMMAGAFMFAGSNTASADVISTGQQHVGTSYAWGGSNPGGFDCSGFTQYVYGQNGVSLPRTAAAQAAAAQPVSASEAQAGDLVFFNDGSGIYHVGIYQGNGQMLDAQNRGVISGDSISYFPGQVTYGRVGGGASAAQAQPSQAQTQGQSAAATDNGQQAQAANTAQPAADTQAQTANTDQQQAAAQPAADDSQAQAANTDQPAADTQAQTTNTDQQAAAQPAADDSQAQTTNTDQQAAAQPAADDSQAHTANTDQPAADTQAQTANADQQPAAETKPVLTDAKLVSQSSNEGKFNPETGYFINGDTQIAVRKSASLKDKITGYLPAGAKISYDGYVVKDGHVWVEYTGYNGDKLYCPVRETHKVAWGSFE
ncbi:NlpC/P60 family protein [Fructilactobacillus carniphilus]|uniref:NlpC/P60 family protein n=1 Tax=Fructilactobacillus carniphilus TaxID=2940297 RepID=A0ABY5BZV1_9LACO|nr:NlpC/P60 family protein [Fructilactobacillus carniphilus]USS91319.1 NlpC/P60 family protein [Fructilactobacillus carniphilus]